VDDHMKGGMQTLYRVLDESGQPETTASIPAVPPGQHSQH